VRVSINVPERSEPTVEGSSLVRNLDPLSVAVSSLKKITAVMLVATLFMTIASIDVANGSCEVINDANPALSDRCSLTGLERHGPAFALLGLLCLAMALGAGLGGSRPAAVALIAIGVVAITITLLSDWPESGETGAIGRSFEGAKGVKGPGLYAELIAGALVGAAGLIRLANPR